MKWLPVFSFALVSVAALPGCTTLVATYDLDEAMKAGNVAAARAAASRGLRVAHDDDRPNRTRSRTGRFLIDRGVLAMAERDWNAAALDLRDGESTVDGDEIARWNFVAHHKPRDASWDGYRRGWNDGIHVPWVPKAYERVMMSPLAALAHLEQGDSSGACVQARRYAVTERHVARYAPDQASARAFGYMVGALACDAADEPELACRYLGDALSLAGEQVLERTGLDERRARCRPAVSFRASSNQTLWIVVAFGTAPQPRLTRGAGDRPLVVIEGGTPSASVFATIAGERVSIPQVVNLVAAATVDYELARRRGQWSHEALRTLPAHVHLVGVEVAAGDHVVEVSIDGAKSARTVRVSDRDRVVSFIAPQQPLAPPDASAVH